jgi:hypothetical protein
MGALDPSAVVAVAVTERGDWSFWYYVSCVGVILIYGSVFCTWWCMYEK